MTTLTAAALAAAVAAAGQDDFSLEGIIGHRVQIRGEALTGARWTDVTGKTNEHLWGQIQCPLFVFQAGNTALLGRTVAAVVVPAVGIGLLYHGLALGLGLGFRLGFQLGLGSRLGVGFGLGSGLGP